MAVRFAFAIVAAGLALAAVACADPAEERARIRAAAERVAQDTASRAWSHAVGVDSVVMLGDTSVVWVSPRNWLATDAPQAGVRVDRDAKIIAIKWIMGG
jgi:hypothetical protein